MHSFLSRGNAILAYSFSILAAATFLCFVSTSFLTHEADVAFNKAVGRIDLEYVPGLGHVEEARITADLETNVTRLFNWNAKELFLYLTAEYRSPDNSLNQVILWDKIIKRGEPAALRYTRVMQEYRFLDTRASLLNNPNVTLYLSWNIIPNAGMLRTYSSVNKVQIKMPGNYNNKATGK